MSQTLRPLDEIIDVPDYMIEYCFGAWDIDSAEQHAFKYNDCSFLRRQDLIRGFSKSVRRNACQNCWESEIQHQGRRVAFYRAPVSEARAYVKRHARSSWEDGKGMRKIVLIGA